MKQASTIVLLASLTVVPVQSVGAMVSLVHSFDVNEQNAWEAHTFTSASSGWRLGDINGPAVSDEVISSVMSSLISLEIRSGCANSSSSGLTLFCAVGLSNVNLGGMVGDTFTEPSLANAGWLQQVDGSTAFDANWNAVGGDPGGYIDASNSSLSTDPTVLSLFAPGRYLGNQLAGFANGLAFQFQKFADGPNAPFPDGSFVMLTGEVAAIPEPSTLALFAPSLLLVFWLARSARLSPIQT